MPLTGPWKLQLSKGVSRVFRGVLGAVPVVDNRCAEVVAESHRSMGISCTPTLTQRAITARGDRMISYKKTWTIFVKRKDITGTREKVPQSSPYLKESSTKVVHTLFLMILGIQLWKHLKHVVNKLILHTGCWDFKKFSSNPTLLRLEIIWPQGVVKHSNEKCWLWLREELGGICRP